jgi:hypothetical protein
MKDIAPVLFIALYFAPTLVALSRRHVNQQAIGILNLFAGWTIVGWVGALVWANTANVRPMSAGPGGLANSRPAVGGESGAAAAPELGPSPPGSAISGSGLR